MAVPHRLKIGIVSSALSPDPRQAVPRSRSAGFSGMQFDAYSPGLSLPDLSQSGRREFRHLLTSNDQELCSLRTDTGPKGLAPGADIERAIDRVDRAMEAAAGLGAPLLCVDLGPLPEPARAAAPKPKITPQQAGLIIIPTAPPAPQEAEPDRPADTAFESSLDAALTEIGRRADRYGVTLALRCDLASLAALERTLRAVDCPWFAVDLDPVAILRDPWPTDEVFSRLGPIVRHVRGRDAVTGHDRRTQPATIGRGSTHWGELLTLLDDAGYNGWITLDPLELPDRPAAAQAGLAHLRSL